MVHRRVAMDEKHSGGRTAPHVVVRRDEKDFKIIDIAVGEKLSGRTTTDPRGTI
jgi:hypothetical protein